jgi:hypothetical protein
MTLLRRLAVLGLFLLAGMPGAWAQKAIELVPGQNFNLYGLNINVSTCTIALSGGSSSACVAGTKLELLQESSPTGHIIFEVTGYTGTFASNGSATTSAALASPNSGTTSTLTIALKVTPVTGATEVVNYAKTTTTGTFTSTCNNGFTCASNSVGTSTTVTGNPNPATMTNSPLTTALLKNGTTNQSLQGNFSTNSNNFTINETLSVHASSNNSAYVLNLASSAINLKTVPEPASIALLLVGFTGLMMTRRRLRASS